MAIWDKGELDDLGEPKDAIWGDDQKPKSVGGFSAPDASNDRPDIEIGGFPFGKGALPGGQSRGLLSGDTGGKRQLGGASPVILKKDAPSAGGVSSGAQEIYAPVKTQASRSVAQAGADHRAGVTYNYVYPTEVECVCHFPEVPYGAKGACKWIKGETFPVLKSTNRATFLLLFGSIWSLITYPLLGPSWVRTIVSGELDTGVGSFTNNTGLSDRAAYILFGFIFLTIGAVVLGLGIYYRISHTWVTFKGGVIEYEQGFIRKGNVITLRPREFVLSAESTSSENKQNIYTIYLVNHINHQKYVLVRGLKENVKYEYMSFFEMLLKESQCQADQLQEVEEIRV